MNRVFLALAFIFLIAFGVRAQTANELSKAEIEGRQLTREILEQAPTTNFSQTGVLTIKNSKGTTNVPVTLDTFPRAGGWIADYVTNPTSNSLASVKLSVLHRDGRTNIYVLYKPHSDSWLRLDSGPVPTINETQIMVPFAGSDFWIADLGLEFFHWPDQKILKHEDKRTRACAVLESTNPNPGPGAYSRVDSWIDNETLGVVHAEAYDANGKLLKIFDPKSFKKVNGQWELQDIEIRNVQTKSRTSIKFDLKSK